MIDKIMSNLGIVAKRLRLSWSLLLDKRVPMWAKLIPIATILYVFSPIDIIPDFVLALGQMDDLMILVGGLELFERIVPEDVMKEHIQASPYDYSFIEARSKSAT